MNLFKDDSFKHNTCYIFSHGRSVRALDPRDHRCPDHRPRPGCHGAHHGVVRWQPEGRQQREQRVEGEQLGGIRLVWFLKQTSFIVFALCLISTKALFVILLIWLFMLISISITCLFTPEKDLRNAWYNYNVWHVEFYVHSNSILILYIIYKPKKEHPHIIWYRFKICQRLPLNPRASRRLSMVSSGSRQWQMTQAYAPASERKRLFCFCASHRNVLNVENFNITIDYFDVWHMMFSCSVECTPLNRSPFMSILFE